MKTTKRPEGMLAYIRSAYASLTKAEKRVADIVLNEGNIVIYDSLTTLAEKAGVGDSSVLRFCRHIGYSGFQEFKLALAQSTSMTKDDESEENDQNQLSRIIGNITNKNIHVIEDTTTLLREQDLETATNMLLKANKSVFFGVGSSGLTAEHAKYRFIRAGFPVESVTDGHLAPVRATLLTPQDTAIVISVSGSTVDIVDVAKIAKENDAKVMCITSHVKSPVTKHADLVLLTASKEKPTESSALSSIIPQMHIFEILFTHALNQLGNQGTEMLRKTASVTSKKLY